MADTVTIGCKIPQGLVLDLYAPAKDRTPGVAPVPVTSVTLKGSRFPRNDAGIALATWDVVGGEFGYGITDGVSADLWNQWLADHADSDLVKQGIVFAVPTLKEAHEEATKNITVKSGMEAIDPENPGKTVKGIEKAPSGEG